MSRLRIERIRQQFWQLKARFARVKTLWLDAQGKVLGEGPDAGVTLAEWCKAHPGCAVDLVLPGSAQHQILCDAKLPIEEREAVRAYAVQQFVHYFGESALRWPVAPWRWGGSRGAAALPNLDLNACRQLASGAGVKLRSAYPAWALFLGQVLIGARQGKFGLGPVLTQKTRLVWVEGAWAWVLEWERGTVLHLQQRRLREATPMALHALLHTLTSGVHTVVAGYGLQDGAALHLGAQVLVLGRLDQKYPPSDFVRRPNWRLMNADPPDFLRQGVLRSPWAWPVAATGLLALATASADAWHARLGKEAAEGRLREMGQHPAHVAPTNPTDPALPAKQRGFEDASLKLLAQLKHDLAFPWEALLSDTERAAQPGSVQWLGLETQVAPPALRLEGWAADRRSALQAAEHLGQQPGWKEVVVGQVLSAEGGQRFDLSAKLQAERMMPPAQLGSPP